MTLSRNQFDVLSVIATENEKLNQKQLVEKTNYSPEIVNKVLEELTSFEYIKYGEITSIGLDALEPYRAKRAVFIAAGFGSRLVPITINTPKPLVRVNGTRIIDTLIDACLKADINEIYIVRGYLGELFEQLLHKYPMIKFLDNPYYQEANNISSIFIARDLLQNSYIFEADLFLNNPKLIRKYHYTSDYLGIKTDKTDDWCFEVENDRIVSWKVGGENCYQEVGISYWSKQDGSMLKTHIKESFEMPDGKEKYWDYAPLSDFKEQYNVGVLPCNFCDVTEIDTFNELKALDKKYDV